MGRKAKFSKEIKVQACEAYQSGKGSFLSIAKTIGTNKVSVMEWYSAYKYHGSSAFDTSKYNNSYSRDFKIQVVKQYFSGNYSTIELSGKFNIALSIVKRWINMYNEGIEINDYDPRGEVYTMKSRKTTFEERLEIVKWVISNDMNYKEAASKNTIRYALIYQWVQKYLKDGSEGLKHKKRGPSKKALIDESSLSEVEKLKLELERERALRERVEFRVELFKKKEEFAQNRRFQK